MYLFTVTQKKNPENILNKFEGQQRIFNLLFEFFICSIQYIPFPVERVMTRHELKLESKVNICDRES